MDDLFAARLQMAVSLGFHIVFACIGMTMPILMAFSEWKWLRTKKQEYLDVAKAWSKGVAIFFAVGAVIFILGIWKILVALRKKKKSDIS